MKKTSLMLMTTVLTLATASIASADNGGKNGDGKGHGMQRPTFAEMDANGDGQITKAEIEAFEAKKFAELDADGNGEISVAEFAAKAPNGNTNRAQKMMDRLDADKSGGLSQAEMTNHGNKADRATKMIKRMDTNGDGQISQAEYDAAPKGKKDKKPDAQGSGTQAPAPTTNGTTSSTPST